MSIVLRLMLTACLVFGFHDGVKRLVASAVTEQPQPIRVEIDPETLHRALEVGRAAEPNAARAVIEGAQRRIDEINRRMPLNLPMPRH